MLALLHPHGTRRIRRTDAAGVMMRRLAGYVVTPKVRSFLNKCDDNQFHIAVGWLIMVCVSVYAKEDIPAARHATLVREYMPPFMASGADRNVFNRNVFLYWLGRDHLR